MFQALGFRDERYHPSNGESNGKENGKHNFWGLFIQELLCSSFRVLLCSGLK